MKYINLEANMPLHTLVNHLKKADYYNKGEAFSYWSIENFRNLPKGIHISYDEEKKKLCAFYIDGKEHRDFIAPINLIFTGKIVEEGNFCRIKGFTFMSAAFNIAVILLIIAVFSAFTLLNNNSNVMIIGVLFLLYFIFVKEHYKENGHQILYFFGECIHKKKKKPNPNKKKGKYAKKM